VSWRVFKNPGALAVGGVAAVLLEFAEPRIRTGVWEHSSYKHDPIGRSQRTGMAAMIGVYAPKAVARRVIQGVTNMHARVSGRTPDGEAYAALDAELLDWVAATAAYGFVSAYDRFVAPLSEAEKRQFYAEGAPVAALYGAHRMIRSDSDFLAMMQALLPRFESHQIVTEFLAIVQSGPSPLRLPRRVRRALAQAAVSILPAPVRERLALGSAYDLAPLTAQLFRAIGALADRVPIRNAPPAQACRRLGLPADFLYRSRSAQARLLRNWTPPREACAMPAECRAHGGVRTASDEAG